MKQLFARLNRVIGEDYEKEKEEAEGEMLRLSKPKVWNVHMEGNAELEMTTQFEEFLFLIAENTKEDLDKISVFRFHSLINYIKSKNKDG